MIEQDNSSNIIIFRSEDGIVDVDVRIEDDTVWLTGQSIWTDY